MMLQVGRDRECPSHRNCVFRLSAVHLPDGHSGVNSGMAGCQGRNWSLRGFKGDPQRLSGRLRPHGWGKTAGAGGTRQGGSSSEAGCLSFCTTRRHSQHSGSCSREGRATGRWGGGLCHNLRKTQKQDWEGYTRVQYFSLTYSRK